MKRCPVEPRNASRRTRYALLAVLFLLPVALLFTPASDAAPTPPRVVYVAGGLSDDDVTCFTIAVAAARPEAVVLLDTPKAAKANRHFLSLYAPTEIIPVGTFTDGVAGLGQRLGKPTALALAWDHGPPVELIAAAERVVVCKAEPRRLFLHAAALAGTLRAPLLLLRDGENDDLARRLRAWKTSEVILVGKTEGFRVPDGVRTTTRAEESAVVADRLERLSKNGPIRNLVLSNPADIGQKAGEMSALSPWLAVTKEAALLLTNDKGDDAAALLRSAAEKAPLAAADVVLIAAGLKAIPVEKRTNPQVGKDAEIEMEPGTPRGEDPFPYATGRLFHDDPAFVLLQLARARLLATQAGKPRKALLVSNPGGGLPLLETFSRQTANELRNNGYQMTALFGDDVDKNQVRKLLPEQDVFLWEGHYKTLTDEFGFLTWNEPVPPALYFMQSCLALKQDEADILWQRGAVAVVGSSTRIYSATGGSFTLAYFDALLYDDQTLGGALRQAKNYLLAYSMLKEKRLGANAEKSGANIRSAWAFTLWGDPTLKLPHPPKPMKQLTAVSHEVRDNTLTLSLPTTAYDKVAVGRYEARMLPNARLAGLLTASPDDEDQRVLVPFVFAEVSLPNAPAGHTPRLISRVPERNFVFRWDGRRKMGYLLVTPRGKDQTELRFRIEWDKSTDAPKGSD